MPFKVKIFRSMADIPRKDWDSVYPNIPESYGYLKTADETLSGQFKFYYVCVYDERGPAFAAPIFVADYPLETTLDGWIKSLAALVRNVLPKSFIFRSVICGCPACEGRLGIRDSALWKDMLAVLVREMDAIAKKEGASILAFKEFSGGYNDPLAPLREERFHRFPALPSVELPLPFSSFEDYMKSLSKKTREDLRRKFKKVDGIVDIKMEVRRDLGDNLDEAYKLYLSNLEGADMTFERISKEFFGRISENMPGDVKFFLWRIDGRLAAFSLCLVRGDVMVGEYLGFDYGVAYKYHLYFVAFRDKVRWCINNGIRVYETGALNYDPKKRLDYKFIPQYIYARHRNSLANRFLSVLIRLLEPERHDPVLKSLRNPS